MEATLVLRLGYRGGDFSGYAEQDGQRTVAGELRRALETFLYRPVELTCAGRTDAGVHALGQHVSLPVFDDELEIASIRFLRALNALVPDDISVNTVLRAPEGFSARFDASERVYRYRIATGPSRPVMAAEHAWWFAGDLDADAMHEAAQPLVGEHDFRSFAKASSVVDKTTMRCLSRVDVTRATEADERLILVDVVGNAFLHNMVRTIVGTLVEVGRARRGVEWPAEVLAGCDRRLAGQCAPACGLTFVDAHYPEGLLVPWDGPETPSEP